MNRTARIYVLDGDASARNGLTRLLRQAGYEVLAFASITESLECLESGASGCVVLDAGTPGLSLDPLYSEFKTRVSRTPLIFVSAADDSDARQKALGLRAAGFFHKPVDGPAFLDAVKWALESADTRKSNHDEE